MKASLRICYFCLAHAIQVWFDFRWKAVLARRSLARATKRAAALALRGVKEAVRWWLRLYRLNSRGRRMVKRKIALTYSCLLRAVITKWAKRTASLRCERARRLIEESRFTSDLDEKERFLCAGLDSIRKSLQKYQAHSRPTSLPPVWGSANHPASGYEGVLSEIRDMEKKLCCVHASVTNPSQLPAQPVKDIPTDKFLKSDNASDGRDDIPLTREMLIAQLQGKVRRTIFDGVQFADLYGEPLHCSTVRV